MPIEYRPGDIFQMDEGVIAHGVNCSGGFGKGVAAQIAKMYPVVRDRYIEKHFGGGWKLGDVQVVPACPGLKIANCATQDRYWKPGEPSDVFVDYDAVRTVMLRLEAAKYEKLYIPKIGAGLAGGDWGRIEKIIGEVFKSSLITVFVL